MTELIASRKRAARQKWPRLTEMSSCAGCAAKLSQGLLTQVLKRLPRIPANGADTNLLLGAETFDDAGVYRISSDTALVQTVDFFTPIVDDPYDFGQIAAANAISDVYAMGGKPLTALNLLGIPADKLSAGTVARILRGGADKAKEAACAVLGGHTICLPEPVYGMSVTGLVDPDKILSNTRARPGDLLLLTKAIGTGIATTAIKRGLASAELSRRAVRSMKRLNTAGNELARRSLVHCATDVTGFGLLGHLANILRASRVGAKLTASAVPPLRSEVLDLIGQECVPGGTRNNLLATEGVVDWGPTEMTFRVLLADAQTSGGLLLSVPPKNLSTVQKVLHAHRTPIAAVIGSIVRARSPLVEVRP